VNNGTGRSRQVALDGYRGRFFESPCEPSPVSGSGTVKLSSSPLVGEEGGGDAYRGRFFGKPLCAIFRFRHQDASHPPSPLVGEGGRGMRGKRRGNAAHRASLPRTLPLRTEGMRGKGARREAHDHRSRLYTEIDEE